VDSTNSTTPTPRALRDELRGIVLRDLLGPASGPEEEVDERSVRERYLVGMLAPARRKEEPESSAPDDDTGYPPVLEDDLAVGGDVQGEDGKPDLLSLPPRMLFPSSFGLTFSVDPTATVLRLTARWGTYRRVRSATLVNPETGANKLVWRRVPAEGVLSSLPLKPGRTETWIPDPTQPDVAIQGRIRRYPDYWVVTLFLVNGQPEPDQLRDQAWLFQPELIVEAPDGAPVFTRRMSARRSDKGDPALRAEERTLEMSYRRRVEFAVGHGVSVRAFPQADRPDRATRVQTQVVPEHEVPRVESPTQLDFLQLADLVGDMKVLGTLPTDGLPAALRPLTDAYRSWIGVQRTRIPNPAEGLSPYAEEAKETLKRCESALARIEEGIELLRSDPNAAAAFQFANRAMHLQRLHYAYAVKVRTGEKPDLAKMDVPGGRTWYAFQLAFLLLNLPGITCLDHPDRRCDADALADLLWFPTGGGKTEAYLGLTAYTLALRRLQGTVAGRSGDSGVAVLMRYTLRLLTLQQFQRATALVCACEVLRREARALGDARWGEEPFRLGLWVGRRVTPNTTAQSEEAVQQARGQRGWEPLQGTPLQLSFCPWCGAGLDAGRDVKVETLESGRARTLIYCGDQSSSCPFCAKNAVGEGLPVVVVDEEIYRRLPGLLISTVDKFAQLPWAGQTQALFGQVDGRCDRHGFRTPDLQDAGSHPARYGLPAARTRAVPLLRPPDLVIQDELHLISGPLGSLVGLYETAVDRLCTWEVDGKQVRPKVIASTATIRRADWQVRSLFQRKVAVFPPQGLDADNSFFAVSRGEKEPGRLYLGICAPGRRLKAALIRVYLAYLAAGQALFEKYGRAADPWMTLVGYFNSMRELGGMRRLVDDDVRARLGKMTGRGLPRRSLGMNDVEELTSRKSSGDIPRILDRLETPFEPAPAPQAAQWPISVLLATNMVSVGVDVKRLGLMVVAGQPKGTAEYIQATSRVGRRCPGLVCTVYNWARPRDLSHYETFEHYHATFYAHVEPLSVTPFAARALDRGLSALLVALVRLRSRDFNANDAAGRIEAGHPLVRDAINTIVDRAARVTGDKAVAEAVRAALKARVDAWVARAQKTPAPAQLGYKDKKDGKTLGLLVNPDAGAWKTFTCMTSLRDVEPAVGLILSDRGMDQPGTAPPPVDETVEESEGTE